MRVSETVPIWRGKNTPVPAHSLFPLGAPRKTALMPEPFVGGFTACFRGGAAQVGGEVKPFEARQFLPPPLKNSPFLPLLCGIWGCEFLTEVFVCPMRAAEFICSMSCWRLICKNYTTKTNSIRHRGKQRPEKTEERRMVLTWEA